MSYSLEDMIKCAEREFAMRKRAYPGWIEKRMMSQEKADWEIGCMEAILNALLKEKRDQDDLFHPFA
jgi:hypothetical protein